MLLVSLISSDNIHDEKSAEEAMAGVKIIEDCIPYVNFKDEKFKKETEKYIKKAKKIIKRDLKQFKDGTI